MPNVSLTIRIPIDLKKRAVAAAKRDDRSVSKYVCRAIRKMLDEKERK